MTSQDDRLALRTVVDFWWAPFKDAKRGTDATALSNWVRLHYGCYCPPGDVQRRRDTDERATPHECVLRRLQDGDRGGCGGSVDSAAGVSSVRDSASCPGFNGQGTVAGVVSGTEHWIPPLRAGRRPAGRALLAWLEDPVAPRVCVVFGSAALGKTHLLTWLATACTGSAVPTRQRPVAALSLAGLSVDSATWMLGARLGVHARTPAELVAALRTLKRDRLVVLWDLNRSVDVKVLVDELIAPLLTLPGLRVVIEADGDLPGPDQPAAVLALDDPRWTDERRFAAWYDSHDGPSPVDAARIYPSPGLALLAAKLLAGTAGLADGDGVAAAWWDALPATARPAVRVLASARRPLTVREWSVLAGPGATHAANLMPADSPAGGTWSLPPGLLRRVVTASADPPDLFDLARAVAATIPRLPDRAPDLVRADSGKLGLLLEQAVLAGTATQLLDDPAFVACADPLAVTAAFTAHPEGGLRSAWRAAGPALVAERSPSARYQVLAARLGERADLAARTAADATWSARWAWWPGHPITSSTMGRCQYEGQLVVADGRGAVTLLDASTGDVAGPAPAMVSQEVTATANDDGVLRSVEERTVPG